MLLVVFDAINNILEVGSIKDKYYIISVGVCGGLSKIEHLQEHDVEEVYENAFNILSIYSEEDDRTEEKIFPPVMGTYHFNFIRRKNLTRSLNALLALPVTTLPLCNVVLLFDEISVHLASVHDKILSVLYLCLYQYQC